MSAMWSGRDEKDWFYATSQNYPKSHTHSSSPVFSFPYCLVPMRPVICDLLNRPLKLALV